MSMTESIFTGYTGGAISDFGDDITEQLSARDIIEETLNRYGLSSLRDFVTDMVFRQNVLDPNILVGRIRERPEYQERFRGNIQRRAAGLNALSEGEYIALENQYRNLFRNSGLPTGFYTDKDTTDMLISNDVSIAEVAERVNQGYEAIANADPEVISEMRRLYGVGDGDLAAYFLDPEKATPLLLRQARTAQIAGEARQAGLEITGTIGEELARAGVTQEQAQQGFGLISQSGEIFGTTTEEAAAGERQFTTEEQVGAVFGTNAAAAQRLRQRARRRQAQFEAGGGFAAQGAEMTGLQ